MATGGDVIALSEADVRNWVNKGQFFAGKNDVVACLVCSGTYATEEHVGSAKHKDYVRQVQADFDYCKSWVCWSYAKALGKHSWTPHNPPSFLTERGAKAKAGWGHEEAPMWTTAAPPPAMVPTPPHGAAGPNIVAGLTEQVEVQAGRIEALEALVRQLMIRIDDLETV